MTHERRLKDILEAISVLHCDLSVEPETVQESLEQIVDDCQARIDALKSDRSSKA